MYRKEPLPLYHSWPLIDRDHYLSLAPVLGGFDYPFERAASQEDGDELAKHGIGLWECDLVQGSLTWSAGVYDIFGIPRGALVRREEIVPLYCDGSRDAMEAMRAHAIRHRRGFTMNVEIRSSNGRRAWMQLTTAPICRGSKVVGLEGIKRLLGHA